MDLRIIPGLIFVIGLVGICLFFRYLDYSVRRDQKKSLEKLASLTCLNCGTPLGSEAAEAAKIAGEKRIAEMMEDAHKRGVRLRRRIVMIYLLPACPRCGSRFAFRPDNEELLPDTR
jgi:hypothetical protein